MNEKSGRKCSKLQYSTNKDFKKKVKKINVKGSKKDTFEISKLNYGSKYYVRIRTYKKIDGRKTYSDWSKTKSVSIPYAKNRFGFKK